MRKLVVLLVLLLGVAGWAEESWQSWSSPDSKYSIDLPAVPSKVSEDANSSVWQSQGDKAIYMVAIINAPNLNKATPEDQDKLIKLAATEFFQALKFTPASEKKIADGYDYAGAMPDTNAPLAAQVRGAAAQQRIYILLTLGAGDSGRAFGSFKTN
jgi:hypothetical protein